MNISDTIPIKSSDIEVLPYDGNGHLIVHKKLNYHIKVNQLVIDLLELIDGQKTIGDISKKFFTTYSREIPTQKIYEILYDELGKYHIIENEKHNYKPLDKPDYLKLSFTLLSKKQIQPITKLMAPLFENMLFYPILLFSFLNVFFLGIENYDITYYGVVQGNLDFNMLFIGGVLLITVFLHEFGHAAAAKHFGADHGEIGFGFYLLKPVMYADVSNVWKLKRKERIIVNLGGLYMQLITAVLFGVLYVFTQRIDFLILMYLKGILGTIINLNPFLRTDGYWILTDLTGVDNLRKKSNEKAISFFKWVMGKGNFSFYTKDLLLALYAIISMSFVVIFLGVVLIKNYHGVLSFPLDLFNFLKNIIANDEKISIYTLKRFVLFFLFYFVLFKLLGKIYRTKTKRLIKDNKREFVYLVVNGILATIYMLSAIGKTLGFKEFVENLKEYPFYFDLLPYSIIGVEYVLACSLMLLVYQKLISKISIGLLILLTLAYAYSYIALGIKECNCFGNIDILNSNNLWVVLTKNLILIMISFYILKRGNEKISKHLKKIVLTTGLVILSVFQIYSHNLNTSSDFVFKYVGVSMHDITIPTSEEIEDKDYLFLFSPTCKHCIQTIPFINKLVSKKKKVLGLTIEEKKEELIDLEKNATINFPVSLMKREELLQLTKKVPVLIEIKNDTIINVLKSNKIKEL